MIPRVYLPLSNAQVWALIVALELIGGGLILWAWVAANHLVWC